MLVSGFLVALSVCSSSVSLELVAGVFVAGTATAKITAATTQKEAYRKMAPDMRRVGLWQMEPKEKVATKEQRWKKEAETRFRVVRILRGGNDS